MSSDRSFCVVDVVALASDRRSLTGVAGASLIEPQGVENRLRGLAGDAGGRFFGSGTLRADAWEGLNDAPGSVLEPPGAVFEACAADFAARSLLSDVGWWL